jgi:hypothetical protein
VKSITHVPTALKLTTPELIEHPDDETSRFILTLSPEVAIALGVYEAPPT